MDYWIYIIKIYGTQHGGALMYGEVNALSEEDALTKAKSISLLMGLEVSRFTAELRADEVIRLKIESGQVRATDAEHKRYVRWGLVAE